MKGVYMAERKIISVYVTMDRIQAHKVAIPYEIDEVELKAKLRDLGYIASYQRTYLTTKVYLENENEDIEICTDEYRTLEELGIKENSGIIIIPGEPEPKKEVHHYHRSGSMRCLYGCPMAQSVEDAMNEAEGYSESDSNVTTGTIADFCE